jgi:hypothetical protein
MSVLIFMVHIEPDSNWQISTVLYRVAKTGQWVTEKKKDENSQSPVAYLFLLNKK